MDNKMTDIMELAKLSGLHEPVAFSEDSTYAKKLTKFAQLLQQDLAPVRDFIACDWEDVIKHGNTRYVINDYIRKFSVMVNEPPPATNPFVKEGCEKFNHD
jgi:hypothetical protein